VTPLIWLGGFGGLNPRAALVAGLGFALPISLAAAVLAQERQERPVRFAQNSNVEKLDALKQHDEELKAARDRQRQSAEAEANLKREIEQIGADRRKLNQDLIDTAGRLRGVESKIAATQERLKPLDDNELSIRKSAPCCHWRGFGRAPADRAPSTASADRKSGRCIAVGAHRYGARRGFAGDAP
jgi:septal ring factor EnvC (AmiA/AmiB activator)